MSITPVNTPSSGTNTAGVIVTAVYSPTPTAGNHLVATLHQNVGGRTTTGPVGWTRITDGTTTAFADNTDACVEMWEKTSDGTEGTVQFSVSGANCQLVMYLYEFPSTLGTVDKVAKKANAAGTFAVTSVASGTTSTLGSSTAFALAAFAANTGTTHARTYSNGFTELSAVTSGSVIRALTASVDLASNAAVSTTYTWTAPSDDVCGLVVVWQVLTGTIGPPAWKPIVGASRAAHRAANW